MYKIEDREYKTVLEAMDDNRVFDIEKMSGGKFVITEGCDSCFCAELNQE